MSMEVYRFIVGTFRCMVVLDGTNAYPHPAHYFFANAPEGELRQDLRSYNLTPETWTEYISPYSSLLIETGVNRVLVDTGAGTLTPATGNLLPSLRSAGIGPEDIDTVILTHAHGDHIGGNLDADGEPAFPKAHYYMAQAEWDFWTTDPDLSQLLIPHEKKEMCIKLAQNNLLPLADHMKFITTEQEIVPGVCAIPAPGHTPGQLALEIASRDQKLLDLADAVLHPIHLEHPDWRAVVDLDADQVEATRRALLERAAGEHMLIFANHFPFPSLGHVTEAGQAWQWHAGEMAMAS